jgi:hypothetical protein
MHNVDMRNTIFALILSAAACASRPPLPTATKNAALAQYARGASFDDIARDLSLSDRDAARAAVHEAINAAATRYYRER